MSPITSVALVQSHYLGNTQLLAFKYDTVFALRMHHMQSTRVRICNFQKFPEGMPPNPPELCQFASHGYLHNILCEDVHTYNL